MVKMFPNIIDNSFNFDAPIRRSNINGLVRLNPAASPAPVQPANHGMQQTPEEVNGLNAMPFSTRSAFGRQELTTFLNRASLVNYGGK